MCLLSLTNSLQRVKRRLVVVFLYNGALGLEGLGLQALEDMQ